MKRLGVFVLLLACVAGLVYLLLETSGMGAERRSAAGAAAGEAGRRGGSGGGDEAGEAPADAAGGATDDDPNRVAGPDLVVTGRVVRGDRGVPGADVAIYRAHPWTDRSGFSWWKRELEEPPGPVATAESGAGGRFEIRFPRRRRFVLHAGAKGGGFRRMLVFAPAEGNPPEILVRLHDEHTLTGKVVTTKREPVAGARVRATTNDWRVTPFGHEATTDERGDFTIEGLAGGGYSVRLEAEGFPLSLQYATLPQRTYVQFVVGAQGAVTGRISDAAGAPVAGATIVISTSDTVTRQRGHARAESGADGTYRIDSLLPGDVQSVLLAHPRYGELSSWRNQVRLPREPVRHGQELRHDVRLEPGVPVRGRAVFAGTGRPAAGARISLLHLNAQYRSMNDVASATADANGAFLFPYVTEGTYALDAKHESAARLAVRWAQNIRPLTIDFYVDGTSAVPEQRLELEATGRVEGRLLGVEDEGNQQRGVNLQVEGQWQNGEIDSLGFFDFPHVPAAEGVVVQTYNPQAQSDPFAVKAGEVAFVEVDAGRDEGFTGVVEDESGRPLAGALVKAIAEPQLRAELSQFMSGQQWGAVRSGADGRFRLGVQGWQRENFKTHKWFVVSLRDGYLLGMVRNLKLPAEGESVEARVVLRPGGAVRGRVVFEGGGPAGNLMVTLRPRREPGAPFETRSTRNAYTRFDGSFEVTGVGDGVYLATVAYADGKAEERPVQAGDDGVTIEVRPTAFIAGVILDAEGNPLTQAQVYAIVPGARKEERRFGTLVGSGRFRINHLEPGAYAVEVAPPQQQQQPYAGPTFQTTRIPPVQTGRDDVVIEIPAGPSIAGKVVDEKNRPLAGAGIVAMPLKVKPGANPWSVARPIAVSNGRGEFVLKDLAEEPVELIAITTGYQPATRKANPGDSGLRLRLEPGAVIEGRLLKGDGTPLANQWLQLQAVSPEIQKKVQDWQMRGGQSWGNLGAWQLTSTSTDGKGGFRFHGLIPGEYRLVFQSDAGVLPPQTLRTGAGPVVLQLRPGLVIKGRIVDPDGDPPVPAANQQIWINAQKDGQWLRGASVDADGYFELKGLAAGEVTLHVWAGNQWETKPVTATAGDLNVLITLQPKQPRPPR